MSNNRHQSRLVELSIYLILYKQSENPIYSCYLVIHLYFSFSLFGL